MQCESKNLAVTTDQIAGEILDLYGKLQEAWSVNLSRAFRIGELLTQKKAALPHGEFLPWVAKCLPFSERTARNYMVVYQNHGKLKSATVADLSEAYRLLSPAKKNPKLAEAYELLKKLRDSSDAEQGRFVFGAVADGGEVIAVPEYGKIAVGIRGEYIYLIEHAPVKAFYATRIHVPHDGTPTIDAAYRPLNAASVAGFFIGFGESIAEIQWEIFPSFGRPTRINSWMYGPNDRAREAA